MQTNNLLQIITLITLVFAGVYIFQDQQPNQSYQEVLTQIAKEVNQSKSTWVANEDISHWKHGERNDYKQLNGKLQTKPPTHTQLPIVETVSNSIPESFDSREHWDQCESIKEIRDQANCGSCWAFGAAEAFSDRWCIASGQKDQTRMSTQQLLTCCDYCGNGCAGGWDNIAWNYFQHEGVVSGNLYDQNEYCQSYTFAPCDHHVKGELGPCPPIIQTPKCSYDCNSDFKGSFASDRHFTSGSGVTILNVEAMQTEIMNNGPVEGSFSVYQDFYSYKSGVYQHLTGDLDGGHAIKILGWGVEDGTPYWLCANSWNYSWGDNGFFKIRRGVNECGIENETTFGYPKIQ